MNKNTKKKDKKNSDKVLLILVILLVVLSIVLVTVKIISGKSLDTDSKTITELYNYFSTEDLSNCNGLFNYASGLVNYDTIDSDTRLCLAYQKSDLVNNLEASTITGEKKEDVCIYSDMRFKKDDDSNDCTISIIDKDVIASTYKKIFGKDIEENETFKSDGFHICYLNEDKYYCGLSESFSYKLGSESYIYRVIQKATEKGSKIEIYDYFIKVKDNICYNNYTTNLQNEKCNEAYKNNQDIDFNFLKSYGTKYKHIYSKNKDGSYSWVSSEPIE